MIYLKFSKYCAKNLLHFLVMQYLRQNDSLLKVAQPLSSQCTEFKILKLCKPER